MVRYNQEVGIMEYEFQDIHLLLKMMLINVKDLHRTMTKVDKILHDSGFQVRLKTFSRDEVEELERLLTLYKKYASELNKMEL